jgi:epoxide hydrolase-like predicted phosphatase
MSTYKALIFDLGKVVFDYSFPEAFAHWAKVSGKTKEDIEKHFEYGPVFEKFERDELTPDEFRKHISADIGFDFEKEEFENGWNNIYLELYPGMDNLLGTIKKTHRIVALTNTNRIHAKRWLTKFDDTLNHFEKIFSSHEIGKRKPESEAFLAVLDYLEMKPSDVIFLDDNPENINAAEKIGIKSILVSSPKQMYSDLKKLKII